MARLKETLIVAAKRAIRPFVPDGVVARLRRPGFSARARVNVDVVEDDRRLRRLWLRATPDTYRIRATSTFAGEIPTASMMVVGGDPVGEGPVVAVAERPLDPAEVHRLLLPLSDPSVMTSVLGEAAPPRVDRGRGNEPVVAPLAIALRRPMWDEVGGGSDVPGLLDRARLAGHRLALTPLLPAGRSPHRADPVDGVGSVVILAVVPLHDVGGGSRSAQMALELAARGYHVAYVAMYGTHESIDLGMRYLHPRLEQFTAQDFDPDRFVARVGAGIGTRLVIVEMPHAGFVPVAAVLRRHGYRIVYDLIDDWSDPALGGWWFKPEYEARTIETADGLVASAPPLVHRLERLSGRAAVEVPNGVNARLFGDRPGPLPPDLPAGDGPILGYHGSLYGSWFDWESLARVARDRPAARVVVIGDERDHPPMPSNVYFLGLKPQKQLPGYLAHTDVGIIPFKVNDTTQAVSPLKAFEFLAMGVPVAAPPLRPLEGLDGVYLAADLREAVGQALTGPRPDRAAALAAHGWGERLARLFGAAGLGLGGGLEQPVRVIQRPAVHYHGRERLLG